MEPTSGCIGTLLANWKEGSRGIFANRQLPWRLGDVFSMKRGHTKL
jgi:hypothetical protein